MLVVWSIGTSPGGGKVEKMLILYNNLWWFMVGCFVFSCFASHGYEWHLHAYYYFPLLLEFQFAGFFLTSIYLFCVINRRWFS